MWAYRSIHSRVDLSWAHTYLVIITGLPSPKIRRAPRLRLHIAILTANLLIYPHCDNLILIPGVGTAFEIPTLVTHECVRTCLYYTPNLINQSRDTNHNLVRQRVEKLLRTTVLGKHGWFGSVSFADCTPGPQDVATFIHLSAQSMADVYGPDIRRSILSIPTKVVCSSVALPRILSMRPFCLPSA